MQVSFGKTFFVAVLFAVALVEAQMIQEVPHGIKDPHRRRCAVQDPDEDWSGGGDTIVLDN